MWLIPPDAAIRGPGCRYHGLVTRRSLLASLLGLPLSACRELRRYHSSVKFSLSTYSPTAGEPFEASIDYMDETDEPCAFVLLRAGTEVDRAELSSGAKKVSLTAREPGPHSVEFRRSDRMIAHRSITVR